MKIGSVKYLTVEGMKSAWVNRLMTLASIGVLVACMVIFGLAVLIGENINKAIGKLEQQNVVMAYMKDYNWALYGEKDTDSSSEADTNSEESTDESDSEESSESSQNDEKADENGIKDSNYVIHSENEAKELCQKIEKIDNVESAEFISSEQGLDSVKESMLDGQEEYFTFLNDEYGNPMSCAAKITMKDMSLFDETLDQIKQLDGIDIIQSQGDLATKITSIKSGVRFAGSAIIAILMVISLVIVSNTIRVTMYNRKLEISIMKAVGATDAFVRIPFVVEGVLIGIVSAFISEGLIYFLYRIATEKIITTMGTTDIVHFRELWWQLLLGFGFIGILAGVLSSVIMISKYLRREGSEFAAI